MSTAPIAHRGQCPHCGAEVLFRVGSSRSVVCEYCQTLVARRGQGYADLGKVADLIPTGTQLSLGDTGRYENASFRVVGRLQYQWEQGVWDEWYIALDDGRWGWLAEAQGRYYVTFRAAPRRLPPPQSIAAGQSVILEGIGKHVVTDLKQATIVTAQGELPNEVTLGSRPFTVDLEGLRGFATIDYGDGTGEPVLFVGRQVRLADLALEDTSGRAVREGEPRVATDKLKCPQCGAPIEPRVPQQTVRMVCSSCQALLDTSQGALQLIAVLHAHGTRPPIPLGRTGTLRGTEYLVVGYMRRSCVVEGIRYPWDEVLLYDPKETSFSWLVRSDGHWQFARSISAAAVSVASGASFEGRRYRFFSGVTGVVDEVLGEFYWAVSIGDKAQLDDYVAPPEGLSRESSGREVNWSHLTHLEPSEVAKAFNVPSIAEDVQIGVGAIQPYPHGDQLRSLTRIAAVAVGLTVLLTFGAGISSPVFEHHFTQEELLHRDEAATTPADANRRVLSYLSPPFELRSRKAIEVAMQTNVTNTWAALTGAIIPAEGGESAPFDLEAAYYAGVTDGESWSEGSRAGSDEIGALPTGDYVLRADIEWDPKAPAPPDVTIRLRQGGSSFGQLLAALFALALPLLLNLHRGSFESSRWENSTVGGD